MTPEKREKLFQKFDKKDRKELTKSTKQNLKKYSFLFADDSSSNVFLRKNIRINPFHTNKLRIKLGNEVYIEQFVTIQGTGNLEIDDYATIGERVTIGCSKYVKIGKFTQIASDCSIRDTNHKFDDLGKPIAQQGIEAKDVIIGEDCWIGSGVSILCGVKIGDGSVIGAGSVVTKDIPKNSVAVGIPAKVIKKRGK